MKRAICTLLSLLLLVSQFYADSGQVGFLAADLNRDQAVNFDDFFLLVDQFGQSCSDECSQLTADLNADQSVNFDDFFLLVDQFGLTLTGLIEPLTDQTVAPGTTLSLALQPVAGIEEPLRYGVLPLPLPDNASFDAAGGVFTFTPALDQAGQSFVVTFGVSAGQRNDCQTFTIAVSEVVAGATGLSGRVVDTNDFTQGVETPVVGATVRLVGTEFSTATDAEGRFTFSGIPVDGLVLDIDPSTALEGPQGAVYAGFREQITVLEGVANIIERPFYLPRIAAESLTAIDPVALTVVENATLGVRVEVAAGSARGADGELFDGQLSISEVPENLAPAALPENLQFGLLVTIQPVGVSFDPPAQLTFPNVDGIAPGNEAEIWSLDPETGEFAVVGIGVVSADGSVIETVEGGIRRADWHGTSQGVRGAGGRIWGASANQDKARCSDCETGSRTTLATGNLSIRHDLVGYRSLETRRFLRLVYNSIYAYPRPILSADVTVDMRFAVPPLLSARLRVAGVDHPEEIFTDTQGLEENRNETLRQVLQFDAGPLATGSYSYSMIFTSHYPRSAVSSTVAGQVLVNNLRTSPFGAGWSLAGVQRLYPQEDGSVVLTEGDGSIKRFELGTLGTGTFTETGRHTVGAFPRDVKTADFNRDGILDLVSADHDSDQISLLLGSGAGEFAAPVDFAVGAGPWDLAVADYNRDGVPDVAVTNELSDDISVYLGNGFGGFRPERRIAVGDRPLMIDSGDMDGDGNPDLVVSGGVDEARGVLVLLGDGTGAFAANGFTETAAQDVQVGDLNGDRRLDVFASLWPNNFVSVLLGDGAGSLAAPVDIEAGTGVTNGAELADVDGDGAVDLLVPNFGSHDVSVLLNDGRGNFAEPLRFPTGRNARRVITGDFDVDGLLDMAVPNQGARTVSVLLGDGTGSFLPAVNYDVGASPRSIVAADFDRDGLLDLAVGNSGDRNISVLLGVGTPTEEVALQAPAGEFTRIVQNEDGSFSRIAPNGSQFQFDALGYHLATADRNGNRTTYEYDSAGLLVGVTDPVGQRTRLNYSNGHLSSVTDPMDRTTSFVYDGDNLVQITDPDGSTRRFVYGADHRLLEQISKDGFATAYTYNFAGQNTGATRPDGSTVEITPARSSRLG